MIRLAIKLSVSGGREGLIRLAIIGCSVVVGVTVLLFTLAGYNALDMQNNRPCWECTYTTNVRPSVDPATSDPLLWRYTKDYVEGRTLERVDLASLGPHAPVPPGIQVLPGAGEFFASPALVSLMKSLPANELADRFPGRLIGTIGDAALTDPGELAAFVGRPAAILEHDARAITVRSIETAPEPHSYSFFLKFLLIAAGIGLLVPMLVLIGTATRLSASRREQRFAAMRLVGATPGQVKQIASIDAVVGSAAGVVGGIALFTILREPVARVVSGWLPFFARDLIPSPPAYVAVVFVVPCLAVAGALLSLRRVTISPLGVSRRTTPRAPSVLRIVPLVVGIALFTSLLFMTRNGSAGNSILAPLTAALLLTMLGLVTAGPWITARALHIVARHTAKVSPLLAVRRLADNPQAAFRAVSGLVLAAFVGALFATFSTAIFGGARTPQSIGVTNTLTVMFYDSETAGLPPANADYLIQQLPTAGQVQIIPIYAQSDDANPDRNATIGLVSCKNLATLPALGSCPPGGTAMSIVTTPLVFNHSTDTLSGRTASLTSESMASLPLQAMLVTARDGNATIERVRTLLANTPGVTQVPETFGEALQANLQSVHTLQKLINGVLAITLFVAGCSLAVAAGGGLSERRRPFTLLRVMGVPLSVLGRVMIIESAVPLVAVTLMSAGAGMGVAADVVTTFSPPGTSIGLPPSSYFVTILIGMAFALAVVGATLPLLGRMTRPETAQFE